MPKSSPQTFSQVDMSTFYNAVSKLAKHKPPAYTNILQSAEASPSSAKNLGLEVGSEMTTAKKPKAAAKTPAQRIEAAIEKAVNDAVIQLNRMVLRQVMHQRIRDILNARFHNVIGPADLDRISRDVARGASYAIAELSEIPAEFMPSQNMAETEQNFTAEPTDEGLD